MDLRSYRVVLTMYHQSLARWRESYYTPRTVRFTVVVTADFTVFVAGYLTTAS